MIAAMFNATDSRREETSSKILEQSKATAPKDGEDDVLNSLTNSLRGGGEDYHCPTWMHYSNETNQCACGTDLHHMVKCNAMLNETYILTCHQMTFDKEQQQILAGPSFYGCVSHVLTDGIYTIVPSNRSQINEAMCGQFNRNGRLCGACMEGYSPLVYTYQLHCKKCTTAESKYNWAKFIAIAFVPLTGFYFFVILFKFNANSPKLHGLVLFAQIFVNPASVRIISSGWRSDLIANFFTKLFTTVYSIWNLDFFRALYPA